MTFTLVLNYQPTLLFFIMILYMIFILFSYKTFYKKENTDLYSFVNRNQYVHACIPSHLYELFGCHADRPLPPGSVSLPLQHLFQCKNLWLQFWRILPVKYNNYMRKFILRRESDWGYLRYRCLDIIDRHKHFGISIKPLGYKIIVCVSILNQIKTNRIITSKA